MSNAYQRENGKRLSVADPRSLTNKDRRHLAKGLKKKLQQHEALSDEAFDLVYSPQVRHLSPIHWTPLAVALKASQKLKELKVKSILDVGSGCGKFCSVLGLMEKEILATGVEQREFLLTSAIKTRNIFELENVNFISGSAFDLNWNDYECIYLFNPFYEHIEPDRVICDDIPIETKQYYSSISITQEKISQLKKGTLVMTYHGFGGIIPNCYTMLSGDACGSDYLRVWLKQ